MHVNLKSTSIQACLLVIASVSLSGCASVATLQDWQFCYANKSRAAEAWKCTFSSESRKTLSADFEAGFKKGYYDTAMNKDCRLPPVAPPKYWSARYQTCEGQACVQEWFRGYQHGIASAQSSNDASSAEVPVSPCAPVMNKTGCGACYSPDNCRCEPGFDSNATPFPMHYGPVDIHEASELPVDIPVVNETPEAPSPSSNPKRDSLQPELPSPVKPADPVEATQIEAATQIIFPVSFGNRPRMIGGYGSKDGQ